MQSRFLCGEPFIVREQTLLPARALTALANFSRLIDDLDRASETLPLDELTEHVIEVAGCWITTVLKKGSEGRRASRTCRNCRRRHASLSRGRDDLAAAGFS